MQLVHSRGKYVPRENLKAAPCLGTIRTKPTDSPVTLGYTAIASTRGKYQIFGVNFSHRHASNDDDDDDDEEEEEEEEDEEDEDREDEDDVDDDDADDDAANKAVCVG
jgi:hypothetical protein